MNRNLILIFTLFISVIAAGQVKSKTKKYPSLLWEITGNGLKQPSYLFGTMHVSNKLAFHLSDSFFLAIKNAEVVALETNPDSWQEDMSKYDFPDESYSLDEEYTSNIPDEYLTSLSFRIRRYEKKLQVALFSRPQVINNLLYRSHSDVSSDFEEDTYLDLYIYQAGKKMGKRVAGVEDYGQSMRLMSEAFRDAAKEKNKKDKSLDYDEDYSPGKLQDAYRSGNLDLLDSINRLSSQSDAFDEKFLYRRNEIQAASIDSILKRSSLFAGVGAAHLPGPRGVIELLRKKGYHLRPVIMGARTSHYKEEVEVKRVPVTFSTQVADDGFYKVDIPGKFYNFSGNDFFDQQQFADMANGSYYMVTRVKTNGLFWGHNVNTVAKKIDSLLYENVPGKILNKTEITRNGYSGFDITNRTRRGDMQRYQVFITPFEVIFFKMGGNGDYVIKGEEAKEFFNSIQLKELKNGGWKKFQPAYGGFAVELPQQPLETINGNVQYDAEDKATGSHFAVIRTDIHNYNFVGEDTFDLALMDESFASSEFIDKNESRKQLIFKGYPALDCRYKCKDGSHLYVRYLVQGPHYYMLTGHYKDAAEGSERFFNSFEITPFIYPQAEKRKDTVMHYSVSSTWYPKQKKEELPMPDNYSISGESDEDNYSFAGNENFKSRWIKNDTTGEAVFVSFIKTPEYYYSSDSSALAEQNEKMFLDKDSALVIRVKRKTILPDGMKVFEIVAGDTSSSRILWSKTFYKNGIGFILLTETDTLSGPSSFLESFFKNFSPADTLVGINPFEKKSKKFFEDFFGTDSVHRNNAIRSVGQVSLDSADIPMLSKAIQSFKWSDRKYLDRKNSFIRKLGEIGVNESADLLKTIYYAAADTVQIQQTALEALVSQHTQYAFNLFRDIIITDPPVLEKAGSGYTVYPPLSSLGMQNREVSSYTNGDFMDELYDSLALTRTILPDLLPLINLDDYKWPMMQLLKTMVDSGLVKAKDYEIYYSKFLFEARQELKKQTIAEKKTAIEKAEQEKNDNPSSPYSYKAEGNNGNENLDVYATLLLPFRKTNPQLGEFFRQLLSSYDKRLKYNTLYLLMQNKQAVPDTLLNYFAGLDEYRYELYQDLKKIKMPEKFPQAFNNHRDLGRSKLVASMPGLQPDSLYYLDSLPATYKTQNGWIYFFRYKQKKDDNFWKLATAGLIPQGPGEFESESENGDDEYTEQDWSDPNSNSDTPGFTGFTDVKISEDEPLKDQLYKQLKKILYSKKKSGRMFYNENIDSLDYLQQQSVE